MIIQQKLYHYTSVESLAMILSTKKIRLSPLSVLDDLQEEKTADISKIGKTVFVSSWTDDDQESIPMWNMYSKLESGVRICAIPNMLESFVVLDNKTIEISGYAHHSKEKDIFPPELKRVIYTQDENLLKPKIVSNDGQQWDQSKLGVYKNIAWEFQREWRYIVRVWPGRDFENDDEDAETIYNKFSQFIDSYIDINIKPEAFESLEITLSPKISIANKMFVDLIKEKFCPTLKIKNSSLTNCIR